MKLKKSHVSIGFLVLILSLTVIGSINQSFMQSFMPQIILESPKSSDGEITIVTPENKTYTGPDSGFYPATYGFEDELGSTYGSDLKFIDEYQGYSQSTFCLIKSIGGYYYGHQYVMNMGDAQGGLYTWGVHNIDNPQSSGTIEFHLRSAIHGSGSAMQRHYLHFRSSDDTIAFRIVSYLHDGKFLYYDGSSWQEIASLTDREWYYHSISFDCDAGVNGQFSWLIRDKQGNEVARLDNIEFENDLNSLDEMYFGTNLNDYGGDTFWDAFGFSWDPDYDVGDNLNEGLLLSYENTTNLDWQAYSLDGGINKTVLGNKTIPMPSDGSHAVQVFGNDSVGTTYESNLRWFTVDTNAYINIVTPEDKIYTESDNGYFYGTHGFECDKAGELPLEFEVLHSPDGAGFIEVDEELAGHKKVCELRKAGGLNAAYVITEFVNNVTSGTIEVWMYKDTDSSTDISQIYLQQSGIGNVAVLGIAYGDMYIHSWGSRTYVAYDVFTKNVWHHIRIDFDVNVGWQFALDGVWYGSGYSYSIENPAVTEITNSHIGTGFSAVNPNYGTWIDAFGYSWHPDYDIGDNLNEGLLLSYEKTSSLEWQGYSLDGQDNVTILGNHTIPVPVNGTHTIQVFGTDSIGTTYESSIRYFTYGTTSVPKITIVSPTPDQFFNNAAPEFEISISGTEINTTWYTIDDGATNITFSGLTGTIDQTEWDKKGDGDINLRFYVNNTLGNSSYSDVTLKKDTTPPLITIDSPLENEVFGKPAPKFNLTIVESNIDLMWYTLDYGVINITHVLFNGTINQSEWNKIGNGTADIRFYVLDEAGNIAFADVTVRKEISDPIVIINAPLENEVYGITAPFFNVSIIEPDFDSMWYTLDDGINNITASDFTGDISQTEWNKKMSGIIIIRFYANDSWGNKGYAEIAVEKDVTDPTIQVNTPIDDALFGYNAPSYDISITEANLDSMWYTLDNGLANIPFSSFTGTIDQTEWNKKGSGTVSIRFYANDTMGNTDYTQVIVIKDLIDPIVTIISPDENEVFGADAPSFEISVTELNLDTMWYTLDNGLTNTPFSSFTGTIDQTEWDKKGTGDVLIKFYASDKAGNEDSADVTVFKDIDIPIITIYSPEMDEFANSKAPSFNISVQEPNIDLMWYTFDYGINQLYFTEFIGLIDQVEWNKYGNGSVVLRFYVSDKGGNEAFSEVLINKDIYAPIITIETPEFGEQIFDYAPIFSISIQEPNLVDFWYSLDNGNTNFTITELTGVIDQVEWKTLPDGPVTIRFYAKDKAGNTDVASVIVTKLTTYTEPPPGIPGYDLYLLIGALSVVSALIIRKRLKS